MFSFKKAVNLTGILVFLIASVVYFFSAERTGSLWDCGEFILGAYKLQVVHPPGAALFVLIGRMFTIVAEMFSSDPSAIAFSVNMMSSIATAMAATFIAWITMILGRTALVGRGGEIETSQAVTLSFAGLVAGLATAFSTSIWFSAVEGEVYALSTFFTAMTFWSAVKWYALPNEAENDKWLVFSIFSAGLSVGVHLLSLLAFPAIALLYYFKRYENHNLKGIFYSLLAGVIGIAFIQKLIIAGIPGLWKSFEIFMVNSMGMPFHSGLIPVVLIFGGLLYYGHKVAIRKAMPLLQLAVVSTGLILSAYTLTGVIVLRASADTPVNMNTPSDVTRLLPYLNREQYGERPLLSGVHYDAQPIGVTRSDRYGIVGDRYEIVDEKLDYTWNDSDKMLFPRIGHNDRADLHQEWRRRLMGEKKATGKPNLAYNIKFFLHYQINWMYWRYFMWNFAGRQNAEQGMYAWDVKDGNWISGIKALDDARLYSSDNLPDTIKNDKARNKYYFLPLIFGILGFFFHLNRSNKEFLSLLMLFLLTGLGIILYSNQPPSEPRERDYVLVGSFMTFCIWIGLGVVALAEFLKDRARIPALPGGILAGILVLTAPIIMGMENFDDHTRKDITAARDYASNFLNSVDENAIIFTYGDNDTYPLWYAQEVEGIRRDVRVVNLSLIAVDWYIDKLRKKVNESAPLKLTIPSDRYRGRSLNQVFLKPESSDYLDLGRALAYTSDKTKEVQGYIGLPGRNFSLTIDPARWRSSFPGVIPDSVQIDNSIRFNLPENTRMITKDELAILDLIASNIYDRPIYFAVTCKQDKLMGVNDQMQLEGLALRVIPQTTPSDRSLSIYGFGKVEANKLYKNVTENWRWGNFDKKDLFVDGSYMAQVQSMKYVMLRAAIYFLRAGDKEKAVTMVNKYFEGFPHMNFKYDSGIIPFLNILAQAEAHDDLKKHLEILALETKQYMDFYISLDENTFQSFKRDFEYTGSSISEILSLAKSTKDAEFEAKIREVLGDFTKELDAETEFLKENEAPVTDTSNTQQ